MNRALVIGYGVAEDDLDGVDNSASKNFVVIVEGDLYFLSCQQYDNSHVVELDFELFVSLRVRGCLKDS